VPVPVHAPLAQPAQLLHLPPGHCASAVQRQEVPAAAHVPGGDVTVLQLPLAQYAPAMDVTGSQSAVSPVPVPVHVPVHWPLELVHLPLEQSESATQRHAVCMELQTGAGASVVAHE